MIRADATRRITLHVCAATLIAGVALAMSSCKANAGTFGGLMVVIRTDLTVPKDIDTVRLQIVRNGSEEFRSDYVLGSGTYQNSLPATLAVVPGQLDSPVTIRAIGMHAGVATTLREAVIVVPRDNVDQLALYLPAEYLCMGQVQQTTTGETATTCPQGQTCVAGSCASNQVSANQLPKYSPPAVFGGGSGPASGACFDTIACFANSVPVTVDPNTCTVQDNLDVSTLNLAVALSPPAPGFCADGRCLIPLAAGSSAGWVVDQGTIRLPPALCSQIADTNFGGILATNTCKPITDDLPPCGQASTAGTPDLSDPTQSGNGPVQASDPATDTGVGTVVSDTTGATTALWIERGDPDRVVARRLIPGKGWGASMVVSAAASGIQVLGQPSLVAAPTGVLVAAWVESQQDVNLQTVQAARFTPAGGWENPALVSDPAATGLIAQPRLSADSGGNLLIAWQQGVDAPQARWLSPAGDWANPFSLAPCDDFDAIAEAGSALVARSWASTTDAVWLDEYALDGSQTGSQTVATAAHGSVARPRVVIFGYDHLVTWTDGDGTSDWLRWSTGNSDSGWTVPEETPLVQSALIDSTVASDGLGGNAVIAWLTTSAVTGGSVFAKHLDAFGAADQSVMVADGVSLNAAGFLLQSATFDFAGNAGITWMQPGVAGNHEVWSAQYKANYGWLAPTRLSDPAEDATYPAMTFDTRGSAIAGWSQSGGGAGGYWLGRLGQQP